MPLKSGGLPLAVSTAVCASCCSPDVAGQGLGVVQLEEVDPP